MRLLLACSSTQSVLSQLVGETVSHQKHCGGLVCVLLASTRTLADSSFLCLEKIYQIKFSLFVYDSPSPYDA